MNDNDNSSPYDESNDNKTKIEEWIIKIVKVLKKTIKTLIEIMQLLIITIIITVLIIIVFIRHENDVKLEMEKCNMACVRKT